MLVFVEGGKPENPEKNPRSKGENQQQTQPTYDVESANRTRATLVGGKCSHHCAISAPLRGLTLQCMLKNQSEPMNFLLSVSPSKEMGNRTRQRKKSLTSAGIEPTTSGFDRPLLALPTELRGQTGASRR